jgi:hypothetical protein
MPASPERNEPSKERGMAKPDFSQDDAQSLAAKLATLDLTPSEQALLAAIIARGTGGEGTGAGGADIPADVTAQLANAFAPGSGPHGPGAQPGSIGPER